MRKILTIAFNDLYMTFSDRNLIIIMIAAPLAIATIIGLAFGGLSGGDISISDIPVAVVNLDEGSGEQNYGQIFVSAFVPPAEGEETSAAAAAPASCPSDETASQAADNNAAILFDLTDAVQLTDPAEARAGVDDGTYTAAIIIPADFSQKIGYGGPTDPVEPAPVEVYANAGSPVTSGIIRSIVESIGTQIATGNIAIAATLDTVIEEYGLMTVGQMATNPEFAATIACAFSRTSSSITIDQQTVAGQQANSATAILVLFGSAQAMFFMLFTGQQGILSIFEERKQWTLQRLIVSPTPRLYILLGKVVGTFVTCLFQMIVLILALTVIGSIMSGQLLWIWGDNILLLAVLIVGTAIMSTGLGIFLAGVARTPEQSATYAQLINIALAIGGGGFGFRLPEAISQFSPLYWGTNAFQKLAAGQTDIALNVAILMIFGLVLFAVGYGMFSRRLDI